MSIAVSTPRCHTTESAYDETNQLEVLLNELLSTDIQIKLLCVLHKPTDLALEPQTSKSTLNWLYGTSI